MSPSSNLSYQRGMSTTMGRRPSHPRLSDIPSMIRLPVSVSDVSGVCCSSQRTPIYKEPVYKDSSYALTADLLIMFVIIVGWFSRLHLALGNSEGLVKGGDSVRIYEVS